MWIKTKDRMPEEKHFHVDGSNYSDGKDRDWSESERVLVVDDNGQYYVDTVYNGKFRTDGHKDCDGFQHYVIAWQPIEKYKFEKYLYENT